MYIICKQRCEGKPYDLIVESARTGTRILTGANARHIADSTRKLGVEIYPYIEYTSSYFTKHSNLSSKDIDLVDFNEKKGTTVVKWKDGSITKVKVQTDKGDRYDAETGLAMCIAKKALGNKGSFNEVFKKWLPEKTK